MFVWCVSCTLSVWFTGILMLTIREVPDLNPSACICEELALICCKWPALFVVFFPERGVCLPTVSLWILFVYIEAAIRFKDLKNFHVDLCRPFAAHWWATMCFYFFDQLFIALWEIRMFYYERHYNQAVGTCETFWKILSSSTWIA